jgi:hypothetical protein
MFLSPDASAGGVNMNSFNSNDKFYSLRMEQEGGSNEMIIDDANACVSPDEVVEESGESNRATITGTGWNQKTLKTRTAEEMVMPM